jgi:predicted membrane channel-forming protein YqfA (hemolysin III family)
MIIEFETITLFRPLLIFLIIALVGVLFFLILIKRSPRVSGFLVVVFSVLSITISALLMYRMGVLADELNREGDPFSFFFS